MPMQMLFVPASCQNYQNGAVRSQLKYVGRVGAGVTVNLFMFDKWDAQYFVHTTVKRVCEINLPPPKIGSANTTLPILLSDTLCASDSVYRVKQ